MTWCEKGSWYILSSISSQTLAVSPGNNNLVDMWHKLWCNSSRAIFFLAGNFFVFDIYFISHQNACFLCGLCSNVTAFFSFSPKYTVQTLYWNKQVCPEFNNAMIKNNPSHKSGAKSTLCNVVMKGSPRSSHIFIRTWPFCFAVTWCLSATSICLSVYYNEPGIKSKTSGVMWHVDPESKIQLVNCELSPKFSLGLLSLTYMRAIDAYILFGHCYSCRCCMQDYLFH